MGTPCSCNVLNSCSDMPWHAMRSMLIGMSRCETSVRSIARISSESLSTTNSQGEVPKFGAIRDCRPKLVWVGRQIFMECLGESLLIAYANIVDLLIIFVKRQFEISGLHAPSIRLRVLAPSGYYDGQTIGSFPIDATNTALKDFIGNHYLGNLKMDLGFQILADHGDWFSRFTGKDTWPTGIEGVRNFE